MQVLQDAFGLEGYKAWTAAAAFGGGLGRRQHLCGALTGAAIAMGMREGQQPSDPASKASDVVRPRIAALLDGFQDRFGGVNCRDLIPFDYTVPGQYEAFRASGLKEQRCHQYVKYAVEKMLS